MKAIYFSRHAPTQSQILDAENMGFEIENLEEGMKLASINIQDLGDLEKVVSNLLSLIEKESIDAIFGVFPAPIQQLIANSAVELAEGNNPPQTVCYSAWNMQRSQEGEKPTFEHLQWCFVGRLSPNAKVWVREW